MCNMEIVAIDVAKDFTVAHTVPVELTVIHIVLILSGVKSTWDRQPRCFESLCTHWRTF